MPEKKVTITNPDNSIEPALDEPKTEIRPETSETPPDDNSNSPQKVPPIESSNANPPEKASKENTESSEKKQSDIVSNLVNWGYTKSDARNINTIIIHSSYNALGGGLYDFEKLLQEYKDYGVAPHYLINRKGTIYQLVADKNTAYHAGESQTPDGRKGVNNFSIGIEVMNTKSDEYTDEQYTSLNRLISILKSKYSIKYILGHEDIAPGRKTDPWNIDWEKVKK